MEVSLSNTPADQVAAAAIVVGVYAGGELTSAAAALDEAAGGAISRLGVAGEITGDAAETTPLLELAGIAAPHVLLIGLGPKSAFDAGAAFRAGGAALKKLAAKERGAISLQCDSDWSAAVVEAFVAGAIVGCQGQDLYRTKKSLHSPEKLEFGTADQQAVAKGEILGESINLVRRLVNTPAQDMFPAQFADEALSLAQLPGVEVDIWDRPRLESEGCGSLLAVARGSAREPRLVIMQYRGAAADAPVLALVGKGVTFDSGGLSIKTSDGMKTMKCDMAGAATVLGAVAAIARLNFPVNVTGYCGLVENMTGPNAYKLGDVLTTRQGTTIEVLNTDAEGRLVLADVLDVARTSGAAKIIDLATLTGACVVALGLEVAGLMSNDQSWCDQVAAAAAATGEQVWQLPMFPEYDELIKSEVADLRNTGQGRWGGAITAAKLLERFVGETPWTHIDIAGPAFRDNAKPWCDAGASGALTRTLVEVARRWEG